MTGKWLRNKVWILKKTAKHVTCKAEIVKNVERLCQCLSSLLTRKCDVITQVVTVTAVLIITYNTVNTLIMCLSHDDQYLNVVKHIKIQMHIFFPWFNFFLSTDMLK